MSQSQRRFAWMRRPMAVVASVVLVGSGAAIAASSIGGATLAPRSTPVVTPNAARVGHFLCYSVVPQRAVTGAPAFPKTPAVVTLIDRFHTSGYVTPVLPAFAHCNPAAKWVYVNQPATAVFGPTIYQSPNPLAHLACFGIAPNPPFQGKSVVVINQFGENPIIVGAQKSLCLPTWKSLTAPPNRPVPQPPALDHYTCYNASIPAGTVSNYNLKPYVASTDEFNPTNAKVLTLSLPGTLCVPTIKIVGTVTYPANLNDPSLLCFHSSVTPIKPVIYDQNQFGEGKLAVRATTAFCVPSVVQ